MRNIPTTIYHYHELPTEKAKEKAREWWADLEARDPAYQSEHIDSLRACVEALRTTSESEALHASHECTLTGYCDDGLLHGYYQKYGHMPTTHQLRDYFEQAWEAEMDHRLSNSEGIEDAILANGYEFNADGTFYTSRT
jgi:hypothetical protein